MILPFSISIHDIADYIADNITDNIAVCNTNIKIYSLIFFDAAYKLFIIRKVKDYGNRRVIVRGGCTGTPDFRRN